MTGENHRHLFCFGMGYSARALAGQLLGEGWRVTGTCRAETRARELAEAGFGALVFDGTKPMAAGTLGDVTHILHSIPPDEDGDPVLNLHGDDIAQLKKLEWFGYLSTTGVYGDRGGAFVDETTPPAPTSARGRYRLAAEEGWLDLWQRSGTPVHIFRLAGIYGPGRSQIDALRAGTARRIVKQGQIFSRIHRDDIVAALRASMAKPHPGRVYNLCDDEAAPPQDVIAYAARLTGCPVPAAIPFEAADLSPMAKSFYSENKRVRNDRLKQELINTLNYPSYREGLEAILKAK